MPARPTSEVDPVRTGLRRAARRVRHAARPLVTVVDPPLTGVVVERDVAVVVRDGTTLRADVFRPDPATGGEPAGPDGRSPVLLCAHPYGKASTPARRRNGWAVPFQFRMLTQSEPFEVSAWTSWEAPDPAFWVPRGYAIVNLDLRGWGASEGVGELLSEQEGRDIADAVEWAAAQRWSTGRVGLTGVSYLAISQWAAAAERPPHLAAINPWEGFTDLYRDLARPGGIREDGFLRLWATMLRRARRSPVTIRREVAARPLLDGWWLDRNRDLEAIDVPALVCASFSDHCLHSRGSFEGHRRIGSVPKYLHTHRGPKWAAYYAGPGRHAQVAFFDRYLLDRATGIDERPPVRVEIRSTGSTVAAVRGTTAWPPPDVAWTALHLDAGPVTAGRAGPARWGGMPPPTANGPRRRRTPAGWLTTGPGAAAEVTFDRSRTARFVHRFDRTTDVVGPMWVRLHVSVDDAPDAHVFVGVDKVRDGRRVGFEGSYGFGDDLVTHGMLRAALAPTRDAGRPGPRTAAPGLPDHPFDREVPRRPGEITVLDVELLPSATRFEAGEELHLLVSGRWFFPTNPLTGQFPAWYERGPTATCRLLTGADHPSALHLPIWPTAPT